MVTGQAADKDGGIPNGELLRRFAEAILDRSRDVAEARAACVDVLGDEATAQAASVVAASMGSIAWPTRPEFGWISKLRAAEATKSSGSWHSKSSAQRAPECNVCGGF